MSFHYRGTERPVIPGASIGISNGSAGTVTALVKRTDVRDGQTYLLSCEHVLRPKYSSTKVVKQPAQSDGFGTGQFNVVGEVVSAAGLSGSGVNHMDAAIARLNPNIKGSNFAYGQMLFYDGIEPNYKADMDIAIIGRTSGFQVGKFQEVSEEYIYIDFGSMGWSEALLFEGARIGKYPCAPGDSGAPIIEAETGKLIGMHIAEHLDGSCGYFCDISHVFNQLHIELL